MAGSKAQDVDSMDRPVTVAPTHASGPPPVVHVGIAHASTGIAGTNEGVVGINVGMVGVNGGHGIPMVPVVMVQQMSPKPMVLTCKSCNIDMTTRVDSKPTWKTHFFAGLLCAMGCWCCVVIPYFVKSCLHGDHYCPNCNAYLGSYYTYA